MQQKQRPNITSHAPVLVFEFLIQRAVPFAVGYSSGIKAPRGGARSHAQPWARATKIEPRVERLGLENGALAMATQESGELGEKITELK